MKNTLSIFFIFLLSCNHNNNDPRLDDELDNIVLSESDSLFTLGVDGALSIDMEVFYPEATGPVPVVVVLHGCGGLYNDAVSKQMESHFLQWIDWGKENKVIMVFPDSYNPRGFSEFCNVAPPEDAVCSPAYERPKDVYAIMQWLHQQNYVDTTRIGLLGFSHGGSTTLASIIDYDYLEKDTWAVSANGTSMEVPGPVDFGRYKFAAAVSYYPGCGFYSYFGSTTNPNSGRYLTTTPVLIHAASLDPLYTGGSYEVLIEKAEINGSSVATGNEMELIIHQDASHSFDGETNGADGTASSLAMQQTTDWFKTKMDF